MAEQPRSAPSISRLRPATIVAVALMALWGVAYWHLSPLSPELLQISRTGPRALALYLSGHYRAAAAAYRSGVEGRLRVPYASDPTGYWALRAGDVNEAERRARTTLDLVPSAVEPVVTLGEIDLERGRPREARASFASVLRRRPDHVDALYLGAVAAARAGEPGPAIEALNRGLRSASAGTRDTVLYRIMELAGQMGERPARERPLCLLAHLHRYLRIFDERQGLIAIDYARRAVTAGDRPADAYLTMGVVLDKRGEYAAAHRAIRRAIEVDPRHAEALRWLAVEAGKTGDVLLEYEMITAAFRAAPTDPYYLEDLERVVVNRLGDPAGMMQLLERAVAADAANGEARARLARLAVRVGDEPRARLHRQRLAELRAQGGETP